MSNIKRDDSGKFIKGAPSPNPKGKSAGREVLNKEITEALRHALSAAHPDGAKGYMLELAQNKPALFVGMLQKVMPNETAVNVAVSLGDAMQEASDRLRAYEAGIIDITPAADSDRPAADKLNKLTLVNKDNALSLDKRRRRSLKPKTED
jgi:hypothetical protein